MFKLTVLLISVTLLNQNVRGDGTCVAPETKLDSKFLVLDVGKLCECHGFAPPPPSSPTAPADGKEATGCDIKLPPNKGLSVSLPIDDLCKCAGYTKPTMAIRTYSPEDSMPTISAKPVSTISKASVSLSPLIETETNTTLTLPEDPETPFKPDLKSDATETTNSTVFVATEVVPTTPKEIFSPATASEIFEGSPSAKEVIKTIDANSTMKSEKEPTTISVSGDRNSTEAALTTTKTVPIGSGEGNKTEAILTTAKTTPTDIETPIGSGKGNTTKATSIFAEITPTIVTPIDSGEKNITEVILTTAKTTSTDIETPIGSGEKNITEATPISAVITPTIVTPIDFGEKNTTEAIPTTVKTASTVASIRSEEVNKTKEILTTTKTAPTIIVTPIRPEEENTTEATPSTTETNRSPIVLKERNSTDDVSPITGDVLTTAKPVSEKTRDSEVTKDSEGEKKVITVAEPTTVPSREPFEKTTSKHIDEVSHDKHVTENRYPYPTGGESAKAKGVRPEKNEPYPIWKVLLILFLSLILGLLVVLVSKLLYNHFRAKTYVIPPGNMQNMELGDTNHD